MATNKKIRTLVLDSEFTTRKLLADYVTKFDNLELVADCDTAEKALNIINSEGIDLVFLEATLPDVSGIEFAKLLKSRDIMVVLISSDPQYAVQGFEVGVMDYILKPISLARLMKTIERAAERCISKNRSKINSAFQDDYLLVKADYKLYRIKYADIMFVEGQSEYITFHLNGKQNVTAYFSMKKLLPELPNQFFRVHKSYIVSLDYVDAIEGVMLAVGERRLPIGKLYKEGLIAKLYNKLPNISPAPTLEDEDDDV